MSTRVGRAGEYLVACCLEQLGAQIAVVHADNFDLCAWVADDVFRVEVKTSADFDQQQPSTYHFSTRSGRDRRPISHCDVVAFAALNLRRVHFRHVDLVTGTSTRIPSKQFSMQHELDTWLAATRR